MKEFLEACFSGSNLPASVLLAVVCIYWVFVILGALDFDLFDFDIQFDPDHASLSDLGLAPLRFLNLGEVPLMIWGSVFSLSFWICAMLIDGTAPQQELVLAAQAVARNAGISLVATKLLTQPLRGRFADVDPHPVEELIGRTCTVTTSEVTTSFGQASFKTEAAPLHLNVRTTEGTLTKGTLAEIVGFDPEKHIYFVRASDHEAR